MEDKQTIEAPLFAELTYKERLKLEFKENSMIYKFYLWLYSKKFERKLRKLDNN